MSDLIERLRAHAALHRGLGVDDDDEQAQWARDLLTAADEIERLTAALRAQPGPVSLDDVEWAGKVHLAEAIRERDELRRQLAEAQQDARRYRYLRDQCSREVDDYGTVGIMFRCDFERYRWPDAAIDAAMGGGDAG